MACGTKRAGSPTVDEGASPKKHTTQQQQQQQQQQSTSAAVVNEATAVASHPALHLRYLAAGETAWQPRDSTVALNVRLDGRIVPSLQGGARVSYSHVVVLDGFTDEFVRSQLLGFLTEPGTAAGDWGSELTQRQLEMMNTPSYGAGSGNTNQHGTDQQVNNAAFGHGCALQLTSDNRGGRADPGAGTSSASGATAVKGAVHGAGRGSVQRQCEWAPPSAAEEARGGALPRDKWERQTADRADVPPTWGVKDHVLRQLGSGHLAAVQEVHARLVRLYPQYRIAHMPSSLIQSQEQPPNSDVDIPANEHASVPAAGGTVLSGGCSAAEADMGCTGDKVGGSSGSGGGSGASASGACRADCDELVANAAVVGDVFDWHIDADPVGLGPSPWTDVYGTYCNGEPGRPLFVSLLLYLDCEWRRNWDAETLFLDSHADVGLVVRPKRYRAILMDQDVLHRLSPPSLAAGRPRFSLVWKLVFLPREDDQHMCIARPQWGPVTSFASAARVDAVKRAMAGLQAGGAA